MTTASVPFVGLTGGMGSGKSTALALLAELGAATISADAIVHELYRGDALRDQVVARWGTSVLADDGTVDRAAIAERVFLSPDERKWLEGVIWPLVGERIWQFRQAADAALAAGAAGAGAGDSGAGAGGGDAPRAAVVETPLLFEAGMAPMYDATIAVIAPEALRTERAAARGHKAVNERDARQLSQDEKAELADHAVVNDGTLDTLRDRLAAVLDEIAPR